jgi:hypothetical protein
LVVPQYVRTDPQVVTASFGAARSGEHLTRLSVAIGSGGAATSSDAPGEFVQLDLRGRGGSIAGVLLVARRAHASFAPFEVALNSGLTLRAIASAGSGNPGTLLGQVAEHFVRSSRSPTWIEWVRQLLWSRARA